MSMLKETLERLDVLMRSRTGDDEALELIVRALHDIASEHSNIRSKVGGTPFTPGHVQASLEGGVS